MSGLFRSIGKLLNGGVDPQKQRQQEFDAIRQQTEAQTAKLKQQAATTSADTERIRAGTADAAKAFEMFQSRATESARQEAPVTPSRSPDLDADVERIKNDKRSAGEAMAEASEKERLRKGRLANITNARGARGLDDTGYKSLRRSLE